MKGGRRKVNERRKVKGRKEGSWRKEVRKEGP
jgi:hypothetical protein